MRKVNRQKRKKEININYLQKFMQELVNEYDISQSELRLLLLREYNKAQKAKEKVEKSAKRLQKIRVKAFDNEEQDLTLVNEEWEGFFQKDQGYLMQECKSC